MSSYDQLYSSNKSQIDSSTRLACSMDVRFGEARTCPAQRILLVRRHDGRALQAGDEAVGGRDGPGSKGWAERSVLRSLAGRVHAVVAAAASYGVGGTSELALSVLLEQLSAKCRALENGLD